MPVDQWMFLDADQMDGDAAAEDLDDGPEAAALHEGPFEVGSAMVDPGRADVSVGALDDTDRRVLVRWFSDEDDGRRTDETVEHEPDLVEMLITQHYAFADGDD
ncbi:MAG: hypothetical protein S0880_37355 [Actinomycetota bacterium]|nr:hypothetical protein [Actinomycetota bacterium]